MLKRIKQVLKRNSITKKYVFNIAQNIVQYLNYDPAKMVKLALRNFYSESAFLHQRHQYIFQFHQRHDTFNTIQNADRWSKVVYSLIPYLCLQNNNIYFFCSSQTLYFKMLGKIQRHTPWVIVAVQYIWSSGYIL